MMLGEIRQSILQRDSSKSPLIGLLLIAICVLLGAVLAALPLMWSGIFLVCGLLVIGTLVHPMVGLGAALVLGPTKPLTDFFVPALPLDLGQIALIVTLGSWGIRLLASKRLVLPRSPLNVPFFVLIGAMLLSLTNALSIGYAVSELTKWLQVLIIVWLVTLSFEERHIPLLLSMVLLAAGVQAAVGVWQFGLRGIGPEHFQILGGRFYRAYGSFEQPNPYAGFLGLTLPVAIGITLGALGVWWQRLQPAFKMRRVASIGARLVNVELLRLVSFAALATLLLAGLLMSWSRGAWIGFGVAAAAIIFAWPRLWWNGVLLLTTGGIAGIIAIRFNLLPAAIMSRLTGFTSFVQTFDVRGVAINDANYSVLERLAHWQAAEEMARYFPWFGVGIGNYEPVYSAFALINWPQPLGHAHNIYLNFLAETGVVGLVAYIGFWASVVILTWRLTREQDVWRRSIAIGLLGTWAHLSAHQLLDKLYVANLHLHIAVLLGVLSVMTLSVQRDTNMMESISDEPAI